MTLSLSLDVSVIVIVINDVISVNAVIATGLSASAADDVDDQCDDDECIYVRCQVADGIVR